MPTSLDPQSASSGFPKNPKEFGYYLRKIKPVLWKCYGIDVKRIHTMHGSMWELRGTRESSGSEGPTE
jgi:hypothetical protein